MRGSCLAVPTVVGALLQAHAVSRCSAANSRRDRVCAPHGPARSSTTPREAEKRERRTHAYPSNGGRQAPRSGLLLRQSREARQSPNQPHEPLTRKAESHRSPSPVRLPISPRPPQSCRERYFEPVADFRLGRERPWAGARVGEGAVSPGRSEGLLRPGRRFPLGSCRWRCGSRRRSTPSRSYCQ